MKLTTLHEAKLAQTGAPHFQRAFTEIKKIKPDLTLDDMARFCANIESYYYDDARDVEHLLYNGVEGTKDNPHAMDELINSEIDPDDEQSWKNLVDNAKSFFKIK